MVARHKGPVELGLCRNSYVSMHLSGASEIKACRGMKVRESEHGECLLS